MDARTMKMIQAIGLVTGVLVGLMGVFVSTTSVRGILWGLDGVCLVLSGGLLAVIHFRKNNDLMAAGFLVFTIGQSLILGTAAMYVSDGSALFAAGTSLWSAG